MFVEIKAKRERDGVCGALSGSLFFVARLGSIPFKRDSVLQEMLKNFVLMMVMAFQFPSNGIVYCKIWPKTKEEEGREEFQFPSNGIVYCKKEMTKEAKGTIEKVSIPFKRDSVLQGTIWDRRIRHRKVSIPFKRDSVLQGTIWDRRIRHRKVSIPFKRDSVLQGTIWDRRIRHRKVSIPFKRDSVLQEMFEAIWPKTKEFQFPSNGIVYCKLASFWGTKREEEFQFPSNGIVCCKSTLFAPSGDGAPYAQIQTRTPQGFF